MKSLFAKNFFMYAMIVVFSFAILGSAFIYQVNRFSAEEKENQLSETAARAAQNTLTFLNSQKVSGWRSEFSSNYLVSMRQLAADCGGMIFVGDGDGDLLFVATDEGCYTQENGVIPKLAADALLRSGTYTDQSNFYGFLSAPCYIRGITVTNGSAVEGMVFVAIPDSSAANLFLNLSRTFIVMTVVVLLITLIATIIVVRSTVKPLKQMATAARSFARGDFSVRVPLPKRQDELYDMTLSFNHMADAMENVENTRRGLIANVSHDLRTPMTTIAGFVDGIRDGTIPPERQGHYLDIISEEVKRLSRMASSMLEISRLESGERVLNKTVFDMSELVRRIIIGFEQKLNDKKIEVELDIPETVNVSADRDDIFQAVYNLVDNAVKFTEQGGTITIYMAEKGGSLKFHIINTGSEIPQENLKYIFDRFYKGDKSRNRSDGGGGSGLGLYIVKTVINRHHGDVYVKSQDNKTEFSFSLPVS